MRKIPGARVQGIFLPNFPGSMPMTRLIKRKNEENINCRKERFGDADMV